MWSRRYRWQAKDHGLSHLFGQRALPADLLTKRLPLCALRRTSPTGCMAHGPMGRALRRLGPLIGHRALAGICTHFWEQQLSLPLAARRVRSTCEPGAIKRVLETLQRGRSAPRGCFWTTVCGLSIMARQLLGWAVGGVGGPWEGWADGRGSLAKAKSGLRRCCEAVMEGVIKKLEWRGHGEGANKVIE